MEDGGQTFLPSSILHSLSSLFSTGAGRRATPENEQQYKSGYDHRNTHHLRRGQPAVDVVRRIVATEVFGNGAENRVANQVKRKNLAIKFPAAEQPREAEIQNQVQQSVINFRRMNAHAMRFMIGGKMNRPRQVAGPAITAAVEQAANATENTAQRNAGGDDVGNFPDGQ